MLLKILWGTILIVGIVWPWVAIDQKDTKGFSSACISYILSYLLAIDQINLFFEYDNWLSTIVPFSFCQFIYVRKFRKAELLLHVPRLWRMVVPSEIPCFFNSSKKMTHNKFYNMLKIDDEKSDVALAFSFCSCHTYACSEISIIYLLPVTWHVPQHHHPQQKDDNVNFFFF